MGVRSAEANACQWVSMTDFVLEYHSPVMLLNEALAEAAALNYGTDSDNALQTAVSEAQGMLAEGTASERVAAYESLLKAINQYKIKNASAEHPVDMTEYVKNGDFRKRTLGGMDIRYFGRGRILPRRDGSVSCSVRLLADRIRTAHR